MEGLSVTIKFVILGEPASKANSREVTRIGQKTMNVIVGANDDGTLKTERMKVGGRNMNRKSDKALAYERDALRQIPPRCRVRFEKPVRVTMRIYYRTERPDLDESLILDILQDRYKLIDGEMRILVQNGVYRNDRQVREKHIFHGIDSRQPRAEIEVEEIEGGKMQASLDLEDAAKTEEAPF